MIGFIVQQYIHIVAPEANPLKAVSVLGYGPNLQILAAIGAVELATWHKTFDENSIPGYLFVHLLIHVFYEAFISFY